MKPVPKPGDPFWLLEAFEEYGVKEIPGPESHPRILEYLKTVDDDGVLTDDNGWCSAGMKFVLAVKCFFECSIVTRLARSWLKWGIPIKKPMRGCLAVLWRGAVDSWMGHICIFLEAGTGDKEGKFLAYGGNQNNQWCCSWYPLEQVLGWRWPPIAENVQAQRRYFPRYKAKLIGEQERKLKDTMIDVSIPWYHQAWCVAVLQSIAGILSIIPATAPIGRGLVVLCEELKKKLPKEKEPTVTFWDVVRKFIEWVKNLFKRRKT